MKKLPHESYIRLREGARILEEDSCGEKVLLLRDGSILKLFRRKHLITSALLYPYAQRFADNAKKLKHLGILSPDIIDTYKIPAIQRSAVHYHPLPGISLRQIHQKNHTCPINLFDKLGKFTAQLHYKGIYFRSMHLGNIILTSEEELGLIDIADLKCQSKPLRKHKLERNFKHIFRDESDREWLLSKCHGDFIESYKEEWQALTKR